VVTNWDGLDAKAFAGIYNSNWVCSVVYATVLKLFKPNSQETAKICETRILSKWLRFVFYTNIHVNLFHLKKL
jgi:hypothetical protein